VPERTAVLEQETVGAQGQRAAGGLAVIVWFRLWQKATQLRSTTIARCGTRRAASAGMQMQSLIPIRMVQPGDPGRPDVPVKPGQMPDPTPIDPDPQGPPDYRDPSGPTYQDEPPPVPLDKRS
jgi:hypothetical protein